MKWAIYHFSRTQTKGNWMHVVVKTFYMIHIVCLLFTATGSFTQHVWLTLKERVSFGESISYSGLAKLCDNPCAQQAVGTAMRNNPVSIIVPCHRVILNSGKPGNYNGGRKNSMKVWLLEYERKVSRGKWNTRCQDANIWHSDKKCR